MEPLQPSPAPYSPPTFPAPMMPPPASSGITAGKIIAGLAVLAMVSVGAYVLFGSTSDEVAMVSPSPSTSLAPLPLASATPTADPAIAGWKTYTNTQYGFEFRYPGDWPTPTLRTGDNTPYLDLGNVMKGACEGTDCFPYIIWIDGPQNVDTVLQELRNDSLVSDIQSTQLAGIKLITYNAGGICQFGTAKWFTPTRTYVLSMHCGSTSDATFIQLLSTFKFTSPTSTVPADWKSFSSKYFTLSFKFPQGFEVRDLQNIISVFKSPYQSTAIGSDNVFLTLTRYDQTLTRADVESHFRSATKDIITSSVTVDGSQFTRLDGVDIGSFEGDSAGRVFLVFFEKSALSVAARPMNQDPAFDPIALSNQILSTFRFSKNDYNTESLSVSVTPESNPLLLRIKGGEKIWEIRNGTRYLLSFDEFQAKGYTFGQVKDVTRANLFQYAPHFQLITLGTSSDSRVWEVTRAGMLHLIPNPSIFNAYGFSWDNVQKVDGHTYNQFTPAALYRLSGDEQVWYLEPNGSRRLIATSQLFNQLGCDPEKVVTVIPDDLALYWEGTPLTPEDMRWACQDASTSRANQI